MLFAGSYLKVVDNSGAKIAKILKVFKKKIKQTVYIGDLVLVSLKKFRSSKKLLKRSIYIGLVVGIKYWLFRKDGTLVKFFNNRVLIFNKQFKFLGSRVYGLILKEVKIQILKYKKYRNFFKKVVVYNSFVV
jgi:large subunit ribosomal protein L14